MSGTDAPAGSLFSLAAEAIAPVVAGCASTLRPAAPDASPPPRAIDYFGPHIVAGWRTQLVGRPGMDQQEEVMALAFAAAGPARETAVAVLTRLVPNAAAEDRALAVEYLTALPRAAQRLLIPDVGTSPWRLPPLLLPLTERTFFGLLPFHAPLFPAGSDLPGTPYRLEEIVGTSRSGVLYRALNPGEFGAPPLAVKVLLDPSRARAARERRETLERMRALGAKTWPPRLVRLLIQATDARLPFLVYDVAPGHDLISYLAIKRPSLDLGLPPARVFDLVRQLATGLSFLHSRGTVHGDLKPANVLVHEDKICLSDIGFAEAVRAGLTAPAAAAGGFDASAQASLFHGSYSEMYRAPEQQAGGRPDPRGDIFALGVLWYQLLLGDFALELDAGAAAGLVDPPFNLPSGQVGLIRQCIGDFADRPGTAQELLSQMRPSVTAILNLAHGGTAKRAPARAAAPGGGASLRRLEEKMARRQAEAAGPAAALATLDPRELQAQFERLKTALADQIERDAIYEARATADALLRLAPEDKDVHDTITFLDEQLQALPVNALEEVRIFSGHRDRVNTVVFMPDGRRLLSGAGGTLTGGDYGEADDVSMRLWEVESGKELRVFTGHSSIVLCVAITPDGRRFVSGSRGGTIALWDVETGRPLRRFDRRMKIVWSVAVSPDGRYALSGSDDKSVRLWNADTGARIRRLEGHSKGVNSVVFSPDGRRALSGSYDNTVRLWDAINGQALSCLEGHLQAVLAVAFTPDGRQAVSAGLDNSVRLWDLSSGRQVRHFIGHTAQVNAVAVSPDGRWVLSGGSDNTVRLWDLRGGREQARSAGHTRDVSSVAFSPDGKQAVSASRDTTLRLFRVPR
jgi:WD40 repeat protein/serine/threonine protein kinase